MNPQRRRIDTDSTSTSVLNSNSENQVEILLDESDAVNAHGLRFCGSIEPENADANANGLWLCWCLPANVINEASDLPETFSALNNEDYNPYLWGMGCWTASNQAPYHFEFTPSTSRTCQKGARIIAHVILSGISAGAVRTNLIMTCFTSS